MKRQPKPARKPRPSEDRRRNRDEKPRTKMTRTATQARAEAVIEEKKRRSQEQVVREEDEGGSLGTFEDYRADEDETSVQAEPGGDAAQALLAAM